jgi:hypothetical protein
MAVPVQFGMNIAVLPGTPHGEPVSPADLAGTKWVRMVFFFSRHFNMDEAKAFAYYDAIVNKYAAQGISCLFIFIQDTFWGNAPWDTGGWEVYAENFGNVCAKIAAHYKGKPVAYQIWNEPDLAAGSSIQMTPQNYAIVFNKTIQKIKAADINATVIMAGLAKGAGDAVRYVDDVRKASPNQKLTADGISIHFYGQWVGAKKPTDAEHPGGVFGSLEESMKIFKNGIPNLPVWITEIGIVQHDDHFRWNDAQNAAIAKYIENVINYIQRNHSGWVKAVTWFAWGDIMENGGMVDLNGNKKPQYTAFMNTVRSQKIEPSPYILTPTTTINVRQPDYTQMERVAQVQGGAPLTILEPVALAKAKLAETTEEQWICVVNPTNGSAAWVAAWLMEVAQESPFTIRRKGGTFVNLRSGNLAQLGVAGQVAAGDKLIPLENASIAFEKINVSKGNETPDALKNWIYIETPMGQRAWVAAWFVKPHTESKIPPPIATTGTSAPTPTPVTPPPATTPAKTADELVAILGEEVKKFASDGIVAGNLYFPLTDDLRRTYAVNVVAGAGSASVLVLARVLGGKIVIEADTKQSLVNNLQARGIARDQIVLAYSGETRPA